MAGQRRALDPQLARQVELRRPLAVAQGVQDQPSRRRAALGSEGGVEGGAHSLRRHRQLTSDRCAARPHAPTLASAFEDELVCQLLIAYGDRHEVARVLTRASRRDPAAAFKISEAGPRPASESRRWRSRSGPGAPPGGACCAERWRARGRARIDRDGACRRPAVQVPTAGHRASQLALVVEHSASDLHVR